MTSPPTVPPRRSATRSGVCGWRVAGLPVFALCVLAFAVPAGAHPAPFSYLDLIVGAGRIDGALVLHVVDVAHELGGAEDRLLEPGVAARLRDRVVALIAPRLSLAADGAALRPQWGALEPAVDRHGVRLSFTIPLARPGVVSVDASLFPYDPVHQTFVNVYEDGTLRQQMIFNAGSDPRPYFTGSTQGTLQVLRTFVPAGVHHILIGPDHILFLVGLLLLGGTWLTLLRIVTAFTIGHSITLSLAALDLVTPPASLVEPAIALSIVFVGADNLMRGSGRDVRAWVALVFGLVHGFGFANVLREFGLPEAALGWSLFSFNLGVEAGQLAIVLIVTGGLAAIRRRSPALAARVASYGSLLVIAAGGYWFVERVFFAGV